MRVVESRVGRRRRSEVSLRNGSYYGRRVRCGSGSTVSPPSEWGSSAFPEEPFGLRRFDLSSRFYSVPVVRLR